MDAASHLKYIGLIILIILFAFNAVCDCRAVNAEYATRDSDRAWGLPLPFVGARPARGLMGVRTLLGGWDGAQFQGKDNVPRLGPARHGQEGGPPWSLASPLLLSVLALGCGLALFLVVLIWLKQMSSTSSSSSDKVETGGGDEPEAGPHPESGGQWIYHPVIRPATTETCDTLPAIPPLTRGVAVCLEERREPVRIKAKGLLERRGSSASLTIDLLHPSQENLSVTPTRECTAEEYLLSVGNVLSRGQLRNCLKDTRSLHKEFWDLPLNHPEKVEVAGSSAKNRYRTIIPNESTRVHLPTETAADPLTGYINANYIRGYDGEEKAFIATQGPLVNTLDDFWLMVWAERSPVVVMITKLMEKSRTKCELYFPVDPGATHTYGEISVSVSSIIVKDGYVIRYLQLQKNEEVRLVAHFWYDSWPDHKTPANAHSLLCLAKDVEAHRSRDRPPSLKDTSPVLSFGRLQFKDDDHEKDLKSSPKVEEADKLISACEITSSEKDKLPLQRLTEADDPEVSKEMDCSAYKTVPVVRSDKLNSPTFYDRLLYSNDDVFQVGSLPQKSPIQSRVQLENIRSKSVEVAPINVQKTEEPKSTPGDFFDFEKLSIAQEAVSATDDSGTSDERKKTSSEISDNLPDSFEKKMYRGVTCTSSRTSEASPNLTHSFDKSTSKLSVDSLSWGGLDVMSPNLTCSEKSPNRTQSSIESPVTHSWSDGRRWLQSSEKSPNRTQSSIESPVTHSWPRSSQGSLGWAQSSEERGPVVVHCSAGIGRTGCFIALCVGVSQLLGENNVDILGIVCRMRYDRGGMVQTAEQYEFVHRALALFERSLPDQSGE